MTGVPSLSCHVMITSVVLHSRSDDQCVQILSNIHKSIEPAGVVLICDQVLPPLGHLQKDALNVMMLDLQMLIMTGLYN
jgi:hypothetical protein